MQPLFSARCNCLYNNDNLSAENLDRWAKELGLQGVAFDSAAVISSVNRVGNWVGGNVHVFSDRVVFTMNSLNAGFQHDTSDLVIPANMIDGVAFGRMLIFAKTVDCDVMDAKLRFRCNGRKNDQLLGAITSVMNRPAPEDR